MKINNQSIIERVKKEGQNFIILQGVKGWNMAMLAAKTGMSKDTLYRMFSSKEQLIKEILIDGILEYQDTIERISHADRSYPDLFLEVIVQFAEFASRLSMENVKTVLLEYPAIEKEFSQAQNRYFNSISAFLERGKSIQYFRQDVDIAFLIRVFNAYTLHFLKYAHPDSIKEDLKMLADYLLKGIKNEPKTT